MNRIGKTNLFIGDQFSAVSDEMVENGIKHVLNMSPVFLPLDESIRYKQIPWEDNIEQEIQPDINKGFQFLDECKGENVLICCQAGRSRSGTMLIAYVMKNYSYGNYKEALNFVRKFRPKIEPNPGFVEKLLAL